METPEFLVTEYQKFRVSNNHEAIFVAIHSIALEFGFKLVKPGYPLYSDEWQASGSIQQSYHHNRCLDVICTFIYVPLYSNSMTTALLNGETISFNLPIQTTKYITNKFRFEDLNTVYKDFDELSRIVKDRLLLPLLAEIEYGAELPQSHGIGSLPLELKAKICERLEVGDLCSMSQVNREYYQIGQTQSIWKKHYTRRFLNESNSGPSLLATSDYKAAYIRKVKSERANKTFNHRHPTLEPDFPWSNYPPFPAPFRRTHLFNFDMFGSDM